MKLRKAIIIAMGMSSTASANTNTQKGIRAMILANKELASVQMRSLMAAMECKDCVHCIEGKALVDGVEMSCQDACDGDCCVSEDGPDELPLGPCDGFTGVLERNRACSGVLSCTWANIAYVSDSCVGFGACAGASSVDKIVNQSCVGIYCKSINSSEVILLFGSVELNYHLACIGIGDEGGRIHLLDDSCRGDAACYEDIFNCNFSTNPGREFQVRTRTNDFHLIIGQSACTKMAVAYGHVGDVVSSCNGKEACANLAEAWGVVEKLEFSCNDHAACRGMAYEGGKVEKVEHSCNNDEACVDMANVEGFVERLVHSCNNEISCAGMAFEEGRVGTVKECCNAGAEICLGVNSDADLFGRDPTCEIPSLMEKALQLVNEDGPTKEEHSQAVLCNVRTLLEIALVDVQVVAYTVDRALSQLGCSAAPGDSDLCDILLEIKHLVMDEVKDEL
ncbi:hypothetical protein THAOC_31364 [Thalassiosira oceanica]|uniref:Uncharacterized protein n=1 Tax=Thalassiosira oceanica TaxID=159749 RepID=K0RLI2_THAOC|nr:hypothetical protein THAOC_31364 [Thalassiosira oceanica]|eukprot:EJK49726.1 hypothetical protein THAOC_31364 [Thalassiosira oceanica]